MSHILHKIVQEVNQQHKTSNEGFEYQEVPRANEIPESLDQLREIRDRMDKQENELNGDEAQALAVTLEMFCDKHGLDKSFISMESYIGTQQGRRAVCQLIDQLRTMYYGK